MVISQNSSVSPIRLPALLRRAWAFSPMLTVLVAVNVLIFAGAAAGLALDTRLVLGAPAWAKTFKFALSVFAYALTLLWMISFVKSRPRAVKVIAFATGAILMLEMVLLVLQAARGQAMHFNESNPFDTGLWRVMTVAIGIFYVVDITGGVLIAREKFVNPVLGLSVKLGIAVALIGFGLGYLMTVPTAPQMAVLVSGGTLEYMGAHTVGALVDGQTRMLPILGWNMDGGDLRIPHFVGIHGAQVIPLIGVLVMGLKTPWLTVANRRALVGVGTAAYLGLTLMTVWQALRNQSIIAPDATTVTAVAALLGAGALAVAAIALTARRTAR